MLTCSFASISLYVFTPMLDDCMYNVRNTYGFFSIDLQRHPTELWHRHTSISLGTRTHEKPSSAIKSSYNSARHIFRHFHDSLCTCDFDLTLLGACLQEGSVWNESDGDDSENEGQNLGKPPAPDFLGGAKFAR